MTSITTASVMKLHSVLHRWREQMKSCNVHRLAVSFWSCVSFIGLGVSLVVFAPTLLDIAHKLNVGVGILSLIFLVRAIGSVIGTVGSGILMDRFPQLQYALLCFVLFGGVAATAIVPVSVHVVMLGVVMFFMGMALGGLDNGVHAILMRLWGDKSGPCMQFLHAAFAIGAFVAPLISKPFIQDTTDTPDTSPVFNASCNDGNISYCEDTTSVVCVCIDTITEACNATSQEIVDILYDNASNCSVISEKGNFNSSFGWAYWISAMFMVLPLLAFLYYSVRYDITNFWRKRTTRSLQLAEETDKQDNSTEDSNIPDAKEDTFTPKTYKFPAFIILFLFIMCYVGSEISYGSLVFTYAVKGKLQFNKQKAATLAAVFWGPFAFTRLFSVILALLKIRASVMMTMNVSGSVIAILILVILPHNNISIWITSGLLGASFASIFPTTMTWLSEHLPVSGKATAVVVAGGNIGDILIPSGIAALVGNVNPDSFVYCIFTLIVASSTLITLLLTLTCIYQRRHKMEVKSVKYRKLEETVDIGIENGELTTPSPPSEVQSL